MRSRDRVVRQLLTIGIGALCEAAVCNGSLFLLSFKPC